MVIENGRLRLPLAVLVLIVTEAASRASHGLRISI